MHGHFYGNFTGNLAHAQSVCTGPFSRGEGPGDEATTAASFSERQEVCGTKLASSANTNKGGSLP